MTTKHRHTKQKRTEQDREDNRKFMMVLAIATLALMAVMYLIFR